jgi:hypothetical protein
MNYENQWGVSVAADAPAEARAEFIKKTYIHLGLAVLAFVAVEWVFFQTGIAESLVRTIAGSRYSWLIVLGAFMGVSYVAERFASTPHSQGMQYLGLGLYVVGEAVVFAPLLYIAAYYTDGNVIPTAGLLTALVFTGLTAIVMFTGKDFSFLRQGLMVAGWAALALIVCSILFGFTLGTIFAAVMVVFAAGYILYYTSNVLHHYPIGSHVAASLALFSSVALLFWYILRILMDRR